jgi:3-keto-disaccharide hydrolase
MVCRTGDQTIVSVPTFASAQIHLEYSVPDMPALRGDGTPNGQYKGNSGVFLHGSYEIQILDSYRNLNRTYPDGTNGSLYRVAAPTVNVSRAPGEWQTFDFIMHAPQCSNGMLTSPGDITLIHNGVLVLDRAVPRVRNDQCQPGMTEMSGPITLQDHEVNGPMTVMRFRNIWFRPLQPGK